MKKQTFNVLSIDFDFFQHVDKKTIMNCYPDGHDLNTELSIFVWANHYADDKTAAILKKVKPDKKRIKEMQTIILFNALMNNDCPTAITNSHSHIYDLIEKYYDKKKHNTINVFNVDMHHDMFDTTATTGLENNKMVTTYKTHDVDCGNWATHVKILCPSSTITWICNDISEELYPCPFVDSIQHSFESIVDKQFDLIFLCRSDIYLPPHLDKQFDKLRETIQTHFTSTWLDPQVTSPREMKNQIDEMKKAFASINQQNKLKQQNVKTNL